jgi:hypothetical protein
MAEEIEGLGKGIKFPEQYKLALSRHKATDMKHDKLTLGEGGSFWGHFYKFIPSSFVSNVKTITKFFEPLNDNSFMETYLRGDDSIGGATMRPIKSMLDLILYCSGETNISRFNNEFGKNNNGLANDGEPKNVYVKFGDDIVYSYSARLQNLNFSVRKDDSGNGKRTIQPSDMLSNLGIVSGSALNVDFQYHLWDLLKSGRSTPEYKIYLLMNPENINDPAGKFNMNDSIFKRSDGVNTLLAKCKSKENTSYSSFDSRIPDEPGPDFFSRFDVVISEIKTISNMCGLIKSFGVELTIKSKGDNFIYSEMSKANNSNAVVRGELSKLYDKFKKIPGTSAKTREDLELLMAAEAAKKGGGDDLQLLSHWHVYNRYYEIYNPVLKQNETKASFSMLDNPVFFVSHDGPTIVRALIEGDNVLFMYSQIIGGQKYECAVSLIRGKVTQPPEFERIQAKYGYITYKFSQYETNKRIYDKILEINGHRTKLLNEKGLEFNSYCASSIPSKKNGNVDYVTNLLKHAITLCLLRNCLCNIESLVDGITNEEYDYYNRNKKELHNIILGLTVESDTEDLKHISAILKVLEDKNKLVIEEESKYDREGNISYMFQKRLDASPDFIASKDWNRVQRTSRGNVGVVDNRVLYEQYFENFAKHFTEDESRAFIDSLNIAAVTFTKDDPVLQNIRELLSYAITRLDTYKSVTGYGEKIKMKISDITSKEVNTIVKIADLQSQFIKKNDLGDVSNFEETKFEDDDMMLGGVRNRKYTPLFASNDRGLPYSPAVSYLSNNLHAALINGHVFTESLAYLSHEYNEYDEDQRSVPDESHLLRRLTIENVPIPENERTRGQTVRLVSEGGKLEHKGGKPPNDFEELLIIGKLLRLLPKDEQIEYINEFTRRSKNPSGENLQKWVNFQFPNPISSFHLIFYTFELFFEDVERKIKTSAYLPEFIAYFFTIKIYADELISLCETTNRDNFVERFKAIRRIGGVFNLLFHSFPYTDKGEESIGELLKTEKFGEFSRITMNLIYQYAGTVEYDKTHEKQIEDNKKILVETGVWNSFMENVGRNTMNEMFDIFRQYDNSTLLIFLGLVKLQETNKPKDMAKMLKRVNENRIFGSSNLTASALWDSEKKAEDKRKMYNKQQDLMFGIFLKNLKKYNNHIFEWKLKDVLNNPIYINSIYSPSSKRTPPRVTKKSTPGKSTPSPRKGTPSPGKATLSFHNKTMQAIPVSGGRKTRRNRK